MGSMSKDAESTDRSARKRCKTSACSATENDPFARICELNHGCKRPSQKVGPQHFCFVAASKVPHSRSRVDVLLVSVLRSGVVLDVR